MAFEFYDSAEVERKVYVENFVSCYNMVPKINKIFSMFLSAKYAMVNLFEKDLLHSFNYPFDKICKKNSSIFLHFTAHLILLILYFPFFLL